MERIIVGIDAEPASSLAIDWVIRRAHHAPVDVTLITAFDTLVDDPTTARAHLLSLSGRIRETHPEAQVSIELANASIHRALEERSRSADLLVIGLHRTRPLRSLLAGELSSNIAARSHCPTVIVPDDWTPHDDGAIVVGVGGDATSDPAVAFAVREAQRRSSILKLVHAWRVTPGSTALANALLMPPLDGERDAHRELLDAVCSRVRTAQPHARMSEHLVEARTRDALLAEGAEAELIVIGTHHYEPAVGLLLGSTSSHLLRDSPIPVCIVPDMTGYSEDENAGVEHNWAAGIDDSDARVLDPLGLGSV